MQLLRVASTMSYQGSPYSGPGDEYDFEDDGYDDLDDFRDREETVPPPAPVLDSDEEEASEAELPNNNEPLEVKEQIYQDKLANFKKQLQQLEDSLHPEFLRRVKRLEHQLQERLRLNRIYKDHMYEVVDREYVAEKKAAAKEFEEKKVELRENLLTDFEDKRKLIESERHSMELNGDSMEVKPVMKRILRRRANEPAPAPEKRRKPLATTLTFQLDERDIEADLRAIQRTTPPRHPVQHNTAQPRKHLNSGSTCDSPIRESETCDTRVEDGKLLYERRWYHRGQSVYVEGRDLPKFPGHIHAITDEAIWVKKTNVERIRIYISQLARGKVTLKRRAS
ncbi:sin3 histone deacetylase corepressor complex component SDS3 isoform X2 [Bombyx mandarina]|uniref:Sin3 histone deacetylase corepressor complex component SDS3 n=2 Tax=Bombyx TaxID=7090 RepID=A0A8R1WJL9_BOMMO|nr:sin3 histone deacetylase corepressor complex component SDS3 isoform X2 [Bombyx mori]XP_028032095.1 sin3 histone deacetylase corepressor complex component SDS3 isoform X2 [Bombyx mandarina]